MFNLKSLRTKKIIIWFVGFLIAIVCYFCEMPISVWCFYPIRPYVDCIWYVLLAVFSVIYFRSDKKIYRTIMFALFLLPVLSALFLIIAFGSGWFHFQ